MDKHDQKELINDPMVKNQLKNRKVTNIFFIKLILKILEFIHHELDHFKEFDRFTNHIPIKPFPFNPIFQFQHPKIKEQIHFISTLDHIMIKLAIVFHTNIL